MKIPIDNIHTFVRRVQGIRRVGSSEPSRCVVKLGRDEPASWDGGDDVRDRLDEVGVADDVVRRQVGDGLRGDPHDQLRQLHGGKYVRRYVQHWTWAHGLRRHGPVRRYRPRWPVNANHGWLDRTSGRSLQGCLTENTVLEETELAASTSDASTLNEVFIVEDEEVSAAHPELLGMFYTGPVS